MVPLYEQIVNQCKALISSDAIKTGDRLESVRSLSSRLGINPNTIQKAYTELENQFICTSSPGKGRYVTADAKCIIHENAKKSTASLDSEISTLVLCGLTYDEIESIVKSSYKKAEKKTEIIKNLNRKD